MPRISSFYGIVIWMYHDEAHHTGRPHFHATYAERGLDRDETLEVLGGGMPKRALRLIREWADLPAAASSSGTGSWPVPPRAPSGLIRCHERPRLRRDEEARRSWRQGPWKATSYVRFEDGTSAEVDLSDLLDQGGVFEPLAEQEFFARLRADSEAGTIVWPNGADIAPESL